MDSILRKIEAIDASTMSARKIAVGWTKTEEGHWIPPGWVRDPDFVPPPAREATGTRPPAIPS